MNGALETEDYRGYRVELHADLDPESPRDWSNLGTMITWEREYGSPDPNDFRCRYSDDRGAYLFRDWLRERRRERKSGDAGVIVLQLHRNGYDGSLSTSEYDPDDDYPDGVIYVTYEDVRREYGVTRITPKVRERVLACLRGEVETYSQYATGAVFGYVVTDGADDHIDSCWGMYDGEGDSYGGYAMQQGREAVDYLIASGREAVPFADDAE